MKNKLKWNSISVIKASIFVIIISLLSGMFKRKLLFFGLGGLVSLIHFYMIFGEIQNNWKISNYFTRASFLTLLILSFYRFTGDNFWYFLPGLFLIKITVMIYTSLDIILDKTVGRKNENFRL